MKLPVVFQGHSKCKVRSQTPAILRVWYSFHYVMAAGTPTGSATQGWAVQRRELRKLVRAHGELAQVHSSNRCCHLCLGAVVRMSELEILLKF